MFNRVYLIFISLCVVGIFAFMGFQHGVSSVCKECLSQKEKPIVAVIDSSKISTHVKGFQKLEAYIQNTRLSLESKIDIHKNSLEEKHKALQNELKSLNKVNASEKKRLEIKKDKVEQLATALHILVASKKEEFELKIKKANEELQKSFKEAIEFIAKKQNIDLIIDSHTSLFYKQNIDITDQVIQYMNHHTPYINLDPVTITDKDISGISEINN